jgi:hypothetical protein
MKDIQNAGSKSRVTPLNLVSTNQSLRINALAHSDKKHNFQIPKRVELDISGL